MLVIYVDDCLIFTPEKHRADTFTLPVLMIACNGHHELISSLDAVAKWAILEFDSGYSIPFATDVESRAYG